MLEVGAESLQVLVAKLWLLEEAVVAEEVEEVKHLHPVPFG